MIDIHSLKTAVFIPVKKLEPAQCESKKSFTFREIQRSCATNPLSTPEAGVPAFHRSAIWRKPGDTSVGNVNISPAKSSCLEGSGIQSGGMSEKLLKSASFSCGRPATSCLSKVKPKQENTHENTIQRPLAGGHQQIKTNLAGYGIKKSSMSRQWKAASAAELERLCSRPVSPDLVALLIDGRHCGRIARSWSWESILPG